MLSLPVNSRLVENYTLLLRKLLVAPLLRHFSDSTKDFGDKIGEKMKSYFHTAEAFSPILAQKEKLNWKEESSPRDLWFGIYHFPPQITFLHKIFLRIKFRRKTACIRIYKRFFFWILD
jgi:hypothetical protein